MRRCMERDFTWESAAMQYEQVFEWASIDPPYILWAEKKKTESQKWRTKKKRKGKPVKVYIDIFILEALAGHVYGQSEG